MTITQVCRHGHTLIQGCPDCLGPDDWHVEEREGSEGR